jgi:hypothetical protein
MPFQKLSALGIALLAQVPVALAPGEVLVLPAGQGVTGGFGGAPLPAQWGSGNPMSGQYLVQLGQYTCLQEYDPGMQYWHTVDVAPGAQILISADGANYRIANTSGCPIGALITNNGSGLTNGFNTVTVTPSAGGSAWNTIVGGAINSTVTITGAGSGYTKPPILVVTPPASQGNTPYVLPTMVCALTTGAITSVTVTNQGAGLVAAPTVTAVPQQGDTTGGGAVLTVNATLALSGLLLAMWPATYNNTGTGLTAVPTFTFSPASTIAATAIMNFTITSFTTGTAGVGYVGAGGALFGGIVAGTAGSNSPGNPLYDKSLSLPVLPPLTVAATTGVPTLAGPFGGINFQAIPTYAAYSAGAAASTAAAITCNVGGANDVVFIQSV